jgi:glucokinase
MILAGDIGGTKTVLALFERSADGLRECASETFASAEHGSLEEILALLFEKHGRPPVEAACFGVAGAVIDGRASTTNLPWRELDERTLARSLDTPRVILLNDLEAAAYGMLVLREDEFVELDRGARAEPRGNAAVIAAGTGLGEAQLFWNGEFHQAVAGEGGHADFAPRTDEEFELLRFLRAELGGRVSWERVLSGPGLHAIYRYTRSCSGPEPEWLAERLRGEDPSAVISEVGLGDRDPVCRRALELFVSIYGAEAGNMALRVLAVGGVFVAGGIAPRILPALRSGAFLEAFRDKGRFSELLRGVPVRVATNPRAPLLGAAHHAARG